MRKIFVIFLSLIYLVLSSGFTQYSHACKAMAVKTYSLTHQNSDEPCPICNSKKKDQNKKKEGCCQHEAKVIKTDDSVTNYSQFDFSVKFWGDAIPNELLGAVFDFAFETETHKTHSYLSSKIPIRGNPLYILHCVYRI